MDRIGFSTLGNSRNVRNYIPNKCANSRCLKLGAIIGGIVIAILFITIIAVVLHLKNDNSNTQLNDLIQESDNPMQLILSGNSRLMYFNTENKTVYDYDKTTSSDTYIGLFEVYGAYNFFWYSVNQSTIFHYSDGHYGQKFKESRIKVQDMAYDHLGENLYVIDKLAETLIVINWPTQSYCILAGDLIRPQHIQVDPHQGFMFILQQSDSILRGNLAGTSIQKIVKSDYLTAMTVDSKTQRIFWSDQVRGIVSSDYEGKNRKVFSMDTLNIVDMAVVNDEIYWLWEENVDDIQSHRLVSCKIDNENCADHSVTDFEYLGEFVSIKATYLHPKRNLSITNPCSKENNICQHFCLLSSKGKFNCACKVGWQLDLDKKSCRETKEFMMYTSDQYFRGRFLDTARNYSVDAILPVPYKINVDEEISFDYDMSTDNLYFSDEKKIYTMKLRSNHSGQYTIMQGDEYKNIKDIAFDWITGNLYYMEKVDKEAYVVKVFNVGLGSQYNKTVIKTVQNVADSIKFYPSLGYLIHYGSSYNHLTGNIYITTANGIEIKMSEVNHVIPGFKSLALDKSDKRIYWILNQYYGQVITTNVNGTDWRKIYISDLSPLRSITVHRKFMYVNTYHTIHRIEKINSNNQVKLVPLLNDHPFSWISAVKIFSESDISSKDNMKHPCSQENGGCEQFCFLHHNKAICECRDSEILDLHGHCVQNPDKEEPKKEEPIKNEETDKKKE